MFRGGSYRTPTYRARCAFRRFIGPDHGRGLRLAIPIQPLLFAEARWPRALGVEGTTSIVCADLDGDGDVDLFCGGSVAVPDDTRRRARSWLYINDGAGTFQDASRTHLPEVFVEFAARQAEAVDVDGDGDLDLAWVCGATVPEQNRLYLNQGGARFVDATATHLPLVADSSAGLAMGDLDGDGDPDMLVANRGRDTGELNRMYLNDGKGHFREVTATHLPPTPPGREEDSTVDLALGDVDGDGDLDLVCANYHYGYQNRLFRNDGTGHFSEVTEACMPATHLDRDGHGDITESVELGDVDADGGTWTWWAPPAGHPPGCS